MSVLLADPITTIEHATEDLAVWAVTLHPELRRLVSLLRAELEALELEDPTAHIERRHFFGFADRILDATARYALEGSS